MNLALSPDIESLLRVRAEDEGMTVEQYVERIAWQEQQAIEELEELALEGLESGDAIPADNDHFWNERHARLAEHVAKAQL